jgi:hypothetical protein
MTAGRPREYDLQKVANDLLAWAAKDDSINLNKFCALNGINPNTMLRWKDEDPKFRGAYEEAKAFLGFRREELLSKGKLHVKAYDLNATVYDAFGREEKLAISKIEADNRKQEEQTHQQIVFKVNYDKSCDSVKISPETISTSDS